MWRWTNGIAMNLLLEREGFLAFITCPSKWRAIFFIEIKLIRRLMDSWACGVCESERELAVIHVAWRWTNGIPMIQITEIIMEKTQDTLDKANDGFFVGWPYVLQKKIIWFNTNHVCFSLVISISRFKTFWEYFSSKCLTNCLLN